jgi:hypothetical protein
MSSEARMIRFFFDVVARQSRRYDFHGRILADGAEARQAAEMVVLDCIVSEDEDWTDGEVEVRDERGCCLFSLPICAERTPLAA